MRASSVQRPRRDDRLELGAVAAGERRLLDESRYESVAAMTSFPPSKRTRMPVSTGRDSSREAERPTREIVSRNASRVDREGAALLDIGQPREVLGAVGVSG